MISSRSNRNVKTVFVTGLVALSVLLSGCNNTAQREPVNEGRMNTALITSFNDTAMENAIITQRTLYPYHFMTDSDQLNELGNATFQSLQAERQSRC
jgi:hypothetical protein